MCQELCCGVGKETHPYTCGHGGSTSHSDLVPAKITYAVIGVTVALGGTGGFYRSVDLEVLLLFNKLE